jgi:hypothetical protein
VAIWKRVEKARGALRLSLGGAGLAAFALGVPALLEAMPFTPAPGDLLGEAVRAKAAACAGTGAKGLILLTGGLAMMGKTVSLSLAMLLLVAGMAGSAVFFRRNAGRALVFGANTPHASGAREAALASLSALPAPPRPSPPSLRPRKAPGPYPYKVELPRREWPKAKKDTWNILHETMLNPETSLKGLNLAEFVAKCARSAGVVFVCGTALPAAGQGTHVFPGEEAWSAWNALTAFVTGSRLDFALRDDGTVFIDDRQRVALEKEPPSEAEELRDEMGLVVRSLDKGWNGTNYDERVDHQVLGGKVALLGTASSFGDAFKRLAEASGVPVLLCNLSEEESGEVYRPFEGAALNPGGEDTLEGHLKKLCFMAGLDYCLSGGGGVIVSSRGAVATERVAWEAHEAQLEKLDQIRLPGGEPVSIPELAEALEKATGLRVIPSQEAWESEIRASGGAVNARGALDELCRSSGLRWALRYGKVWILN